MITKTKPSAPFVVYDQRLDFGQVSRKYSTRLSSSTITYGEGPAAIGSSPVWKPCDSSWSSKTTGAVCSTTRIIRSRRTPSWQQVIQNNLYVPDVGFSVAYPPSPNWSELTDQFWSNVDLNTGEAVMAYSAVLQAVPLIGGVFKINSILRKIAKWAKSSLRKRPFTEVIKTAISADFINRFVVQTTIQDMQMVANSMNYVQNCIATAYRRNVEPTAFKPSASTTVSGSTGSGSQTIGNERIYYRYQEKATWTRKLFILADVRYNVDPATPLRLWLNRVGLTRPLESAWDLVPFSFVVDYFFRAGDFLTHISEEMSSIEGLKGQVLGLRGIWYTDSVKRGIEFTYSGISKPGLGNEYYYDVYDVQPGQSSRTIGEFHRHPFTGDLSQIGFWDRGGLWQPQLSSTRSRTIAQLFIQAKL